MAAPQAIVNALFSRIDLIFLNIYDGWYIGNVRTTSMNTHIGAGVAALVIFIGAALGHYYLTKGTSMAMPETHAEESAGHTEEKNAADHSMAEHIKMMDDGRTVMAMGGMLNPAVLHATAGKSLRVVNHEGAPVKLIFASGMETSEVPPGGEASFTAPQEVGRYEYHSSQNPNIQGVLVVEE